MKQDAVMELMRMPSWCTSRAGHEDTSEHNKCLNFMCPCSNICALHVNREVGTTGALSHIFVHVRNKTDFGQHTFMLCYVINNTNGEVCSDITVQCLVSKKQILVKNKTQ